MGRTVREKNLETRTARLRLPVRSEPYWRALDKGLHIGYRRRKDGGAWTARRRTEAMASKYEEKHLGAADDAADADGAVVLDFAQAQAKARRWYQDRARRDLGLGPEREGPYTVADAIADYLTEYKARGRAVATTEIAVRAHILPHLGAVEVAKLTKRRIEDWRNDLAAAPRRLRSGRAADVRHDAAPADADAIRRRKATVNRVMHILKAALNHAWREGAVATDAAWRRVQPFKDVDAPVVRYLSEAECVRLVNACTVGFRPLVRAALLTGCRYGELAALKVGDFNADAGTLAVRTSKSGKARHVVLTDEGRDFFAEAAAGRAAGELLFRRGGGGPWGRSHQTRPLADACKRANIAPPVRFHDLRHTHGSLLAMQGVPLPVIAKQLGHADGRMTERHYAHLSPSYVADAIRAGFPTLGIVEETNVKALASGAGAPRRG